MKEFFIKTYRGRQFEFTRVTHSSFDPWYYISVNLDDLKNGYSFQQVVPAGSWFASKPVDETGFSFVGCTVAPGFDFADFEMGARDELLKEYPQHEEWINLLS